MNFRNLLLTSVTLACVALPVAAMAGTADKKIALSNNYAGNSWRQAMLTSWEKVTGEAVKSGVVAAADPFTTSENQATEQAAQIQNMILQGYNAIVIDAASPTALNGAIKDTERDLAGGIIIHPGQELMTFAVGNAKIVPRGNAISIDKQVSGSAKIDPLMAAFNAVALMAMNPEPVGRSYLGSSELLVL